MTRSSMLAVLLTLLAVFPGILFNSTYEEHYSEVHGWFTRTRTQARKVKNFLRGLSRSWKGFFALSAVTALLYGFLSPDLGLNRASLSLLAGVAAAIILVTIVAEFLSGFYVSRVAKKRIYLRLFPGSVIVAIFCVAISRALNFLPGYLYGIVAAAAFRGGLSKEHEGRSIAIASVSVFVAGVACWFLWIPVKAAASRPGASIGILILDAMLVATFVAAIEGLLFGLMPLRFLDGSKLVAWNRFLWAVIFAVSMFGFVHILLDPAVGYVSFSQQASTAVVLGLFGAFAIFSMAFWGYFRFRPAPE